MEAPPPYYSPAPKKSNTGLIVGLILGGVVVCCVLPIVGLGGLGWWGLTKAKGFVQCSITFADVQRAIHSYASAHDGRLPKAATWQTDIRPFFDKEVAREAAEKNPFASQTSNGTLGCTDGEGSFTGISLNKAVAGKKLSEITDPSDTVLVFEVPTQGTNLASDYKPQDFEASPKTFNKKRGWYIVRVDGSPVLISRGGRKTEVNGSGISIETKDSSGGETDSK